MSRRIIDLGRERSVRNAVIIAARKNGLDQRAARHVARYGLHLLGNGSSAARAISQATRYAHVRSGRHSWISPEPPEAA